MVSPVKDPAKVRAGQIGMRKRWGEPRVVRLDDLTDDQRAIVRALVDMVRSPRTEKAVAEGQSPATANAEVRGGSLDSAA